MNQNQELAVAQMRRAVHNLGSSTEGYGDITLMRFLVARSFDTDKATKMFVQWKDWRASFVPLNYIPESQVTDELQHKKIYLQSLSTNGHPVIIVKVHMHTHNKDQLQFKSGSIPIKWIMLCNREKLQHYVECVLHKLYPLLLWESYGYNFVSDAYASRCAGFVVHLLDKTIASSFRPKEIGNEKLIAVLDLQKLAYKNIDVRGLITGFQFLQDYYPERLAKCYLLNMPGFFVRVWRLVSRFLEKATLEKIVIVSKEEERRGLVREVGADALPEEYGGRAKLTLLQDFELKELDNKVG